MRNPNKGPGFLNQVPTLARVHEAKRAKCLLCALRVPRTLAQALVSCGARAESVRSTTNPSPGAGASD